MICDTIRDRLDDYAGDRLSADERQAVDRHLEACPECREDLLALQVVAARVARLPRSIPPDRELWPGIERRIGPARRILLIAASILILFLPAVLLLRGGHGGVEVGSEVAALVTSYRTAASELQQQIPPSPAAHPGGPALVRQLGTLDTAIEESEAAFRDDPADPAVQALLLSAHRKKLHLLRQAAAFDSEG